MNIYTFYESINEPWINKNDYDKLTEIWKKSWSYYGWNPIIYNLKDCENCEGYEELYTACEKLPTNNPKIYEMYCFLRWIFMAKNGGWYADLDMINYGFTPFNCEGKIVSTSTTLHCSAIHMTKDGYKEIINIIKSLSIKDSLPYFKNTSHISDICAFMKYDSNKIDIKSVPSQIVEYGFQGYEKASIVHYPLDIKNKNPNCDKTRVQLILEDERIKKFNISINL